MFLRLWNFICGYVIISVKGYFSEKFINIASKRKIKLWHLKRDENKDLILKCSVKDFRKIRPVALKSRCKVHIIKKVGLPFLMRKYRKRKAFVIGLILCVLTIWFMSQIIWNIEVQGDPTISLTDISDFVESLGIYPGVMKSTIDIDQVTEDILDEMPEVGWVGVNLEGTNLYINVTKREPVPEKVPLDFPSDVIAKKEGIVKQVIPRKGIVLVKPGDAVLKGQVLITGTFIPKYDPEREMHLHATGQVIAMTLYEETRSIEMQEVEKYRTGETYTNTILEIFGIDIGFKPKEVHYSLYDTSVETKHISITDNLKLPIVIRKSIFHEVDEKIYDISFEEAKENAIEDAYRACLDKVPQGANIVNITTKVIPLDNGSLAVKVSLECEEDIGMEVEQKIPEVPEATDDNTK